MSNPPKWGIVSTIKAPLREIADFAAHHLDLGAHRLLIYLDDDDPATCERLSRHPRIRVELAGPQHWRGNRRPVKHQVRQSQNARHAYRRKAADLDWLAHIDVDEFLWPLTPLEDQLQALPADCTCARARPLEALSSEGCDLPADVTAFKATARARADRNAQTAAIYPTYGAQLNGGFLSHVAGKLFIRTGIADVDVKIHNIMIGDVQNPGQQELPETELLHLHAPSLSGWLERFRYRHEELLPPRSRPTRARESGRLTMHEYDLPSSSTARAKPG
ncbi:MAG: glycosyltransferase family 2 protein [Paracoccaceae bacterium]